MIIKHPEMCTKLEIWAPKYHADNGWEVWLHKVKTDHATGTIIIDFTKAKHLAGQRHAILKSEAQKYPVGSNGKAPMYRVPYSALESWSSAREVAETAKSIFSN